jgi:hypothetical protein
MLSLAKMPSGVNAFEISDIQEEKLTPDQPVPGELIFWAISTVTAGWPALRRATLAECI